MYLMYVDESGDPGTSCSKTDLYILTGLVIHELSWRKTLDDLIEFRRAVRKEYGWKVREEIHAQKMINGRVSLNKGVERNSRFIILRKSLDWIASRVDIGVITVVVEKQGYQQASEVFESAWSFLIQRFENTIQHKNFEGLKNPEDKGIIIPDNTDGEALRMLMRKMRHYNPIPSKFSDEIRNVPISAIVEDPVFRDSRHSYFIQLADICAYFARQHLKPNRVVRKQGAKKYYERLGPAIVKKASTNHPLGMVIDRVGGGLTPPVLSHHRTYSSVYGDS